MGELINVFIDTCIYRQDSWRNKAAFRTITHLCKTNNMTIHIPFFVEREFISQLRDDYKKDITGSLSQIDSLLRKHMSPKQITKVKRIKQELEEIDTKLDRYISEEFNKWVKQIKAVKYGIRSSYGKRVAEAYFNGNPPFKYKKSRDDIPDSFIWETIIDITKTVGRLKIITFDEKFRKSLGTLSNIDVYKSLDDFMIDPEVKELIRKDTIEKNTSGFIHLINEDKLLSNINPLFEEELVGEEVTGSVIPEDNEEARILCINSLENLKIDKTEIQYYGGGEFIIPFHITIDARLNYAIFIAEYYCLPEEKAENISKSELNDHYYDAEEDYFLEIDGLIGIKIDENEFEQKELPEDEMEALFDDAEFSIDEIKKIEVEEIDYA